MIAETFWCMTTVPPGGAEMIFAIRAAARSTSGSQSLHAVIDFVRHSSKNSPGRPSPSPARSRASAR